MIQAYLILISVKMMWSEYGFSISATFPIVAPTIAIANSEFAISYRLSSLKVASDKYLKLS